MNKLEMAHQYAMELVASPDYEDNMSLKDFVKHVWKYADAMQAEADLRAKQEVEKQSAEIKSMLTPITEWQPDWSKIPQGYDFFCIGNKNGASFFTNMHPELMDDYYYVGKDAIRVFDCGYTGNWQDSLRKRP